MGYAHHPSLKLQYPARMLEQYLTDHEQRLELPRPVPLERCL